MLILWDVVVKGPCISNKTIDGITTEKSSEDWDENCKNVCYMNAKVVNMLYYELNACECNIKSMCKNSNEYETH